MKNVFALAVTLCLGFTAMSQTVAPAATANSDKTTEKKACCAKAEGSCCAKAESGAEKKTSTSKVKAETPAVERKKKGRANATTKSK
jgi:hypothetical protein